MKLKTRLLLPILTIALIFAQAIGSSPLMLANYIASAPYVSQGDMTARGLYISKKADAIQVEVRDVKSGLPVLPSQEFTKNDELEVVIGSNFEGYVYIINVEKSGSSEKRFLIYPNPDVGDNGIKPNKPLKLSVGFDTKPAVEVFQVIVSNSRIGFLDSVLNGTTCSKKENRCGLNDEVAVREALLVGDKGSSTERVRMGIISKHEESQQQESAFRSRSIKLSAGKDKDEKSTYVAIPIEGSGGSRLKPGDFFAFEIRLKHF